MIHPDGGLYFYHTQLVGIHLFFSYRGLTRPHIQRIYTDVYMYDVNERKEVEAFAEYMRSLCQFYEKDLPGFPIDYDTVLHTHVLNDETLEWEYYVVDHGTRSVFWVQDYCFTSSEVHGAKSPSHISKSLFFRLHLAVT